MDDLVTTEWLARNLGAADLAIVDSSFFMPADQRDPGAEFLAEHIPGARFLDLDGVSDHKNPAPHMLPPAAEFGAAMTALGVGRDDRIVVYDNSPLRTAARGWFMFRYFGSERVAILDGGFQKWKREGRPIEAGPAAHRDGRYDAVKEDRAVVTKNEVLRGVEMPLVDARGRERFEGSAADPRPGIAAGHIPGAHNLPFSSLYREDGTLKSDDLLRKEFESAGIDPEKPFVASCGSGVTANSLIFAARRLGGRGHKLYDGSWSEYGADPAAPKELGPAR
jgi:thiosulfate/3-mercaptopyruvate sulfurtransferase